MIFDCANDTKKIFEFAKWGRSKFCKMQSGDGAMPCVCLLQRPAHGPKFARISECFCKVGTEQILQNAKWGRSKFCDLRLQNNSSVPISHGELRLKISTTANRVSRLLLSPSVTSCHLPRQMEAFYGVSRTPRPTLKFFSAGASPPPY